MSKEQATMQMETTTKSTTEDIEKNKLARDIKLAEMRMKQSLSQRQVTPNGIQVDMIAEDVRGALARRLVPEAFVHEGVKFEPGQTRKALSDYKKGSTMSVAYTASTDPDHKLMINQGWIPVVDEFGQHAAEPRGDRLYKRSILFERDSQQRSNIISDQRIKSVGAELKKNAPYKEDILEDETTMEKNK